MQIFYTFKKATLW